MNEMFTGHFEDIIVDEISLEGLEGITLEALWARLAYILKIKLPLRNHICTNVWNFILKLPRHLKFFILPKPRSQLHINERIDKLDPDPIEISSTGPSQLYKYNPINDGPIRGSCEFYNERAEIGHGDLKDKTLEEIVEKWGDTFIIVAAQHLREQALLMDTHIPSLLSEIKLQQYCFLEKIGISRFYGESTIGKNSLLAICNDSVLLFHIRSRLSRLKLINKQHFCEKSQTGSLLRLIRFATIYIPKQIIVLADAIKYLQDTPHGIAEHNKLTSYIGKTYGVCVKKIFQTSLFKKYIISDKFPYREIYPSANPDQWQKKAHKKVEKILKGLKLRDMKISFDDICEDEDVEDEETVKSFLTKENAYLDMTMCEQIYEKVKSFGVEGCSQSDLAKFLGCRKLCMRRLLKKMISIGVLSHYLKDSGRQRLKMYILTKYLQMNLKKLQPPEPETIAELSFNSEKIPEDELLEPLKEADPVTCLEFADKNEPDFKMYVKEFFDNSIRPAKRHNSNMTQKQMQRRETVLKITKENKIIDSIQLIKAIVQSEENLGYTDKICRKSLSRLLTPLVDQNLIRIYDITMQWRDYAKNMKLICLAPINLEHKILTDELLKLKENFFNMITMKRHKARTDALVLMSKHKRRYNLLNQGRTRTTALHGGGAKYIRAKILHEILFYLVHELKSSQEPIKFDEVVESWKQFDPSIDPIELRSELPDIYCKDVNWTMFLTPIPIDEEYKKGWICIKDILRRIPLVLLLKLHRVNDNANNLLQKYLKHPIKRYYTLQSLPLEMHDFLRFDKSYVRSVEEILKLLAYIGLVQFGPRTFRDLIRNYIYVNRNTLFLDTSPSEPGYSQISDDRNYKEVRSYLNTQADVVNFWSSLQSTCMATKLGYRGKKAPGREQHHLLGIVPECSADDAEKNDVGYLIGNRRGAAGLDWKLFAHKTRNWDLAVSQAKRPEIIMKPRSQKRYTAVKIPMRGVRSVVYKRYRKPVVVRQLCTKKVLYDEVDKGCLKLMEQLRVRWHYKEDRLLMICRVAMDFLQGNSGQRAISCLTCRDILHWHLQSFEKTSRSCQRRILYLMRNKANVNQVNSWLNDLYQNEYISRAYGHNFLVELRKLYPVSDICAVAARVYFVQVVCFLIQLLDKTSLRQTDIIPETLQQFMLLYRQSYDNTAQIKHFDPETTDDVNESTINALIHGSVCCQRDKMLYNIQLFEIYKNYDEGLIDRCYKKVRSDQMIVAGKICNRPHNYTLMGKKVSISNIYRQQFYLLLPYSVYGQYYEALETLLHTFFSQDTATNRSATYTCVNSGTSIFILELASLPGVIFDIQAPKQVLKFDPLHVQNTVRTPDKILDHFRNLLDPSVQQVEYGKDISIDEPNTAQTKVRFSINVPIHKITYNPYDVISKLPDSDMHFFCALQHMNTEIDLANLQDKPYQCPFRCILQEENYLETISKILADNEILINDLPIIDKRLATMPDDEDIEKKMLLHSENIMQVFSQVRTFIQQKQCNDQKRDLGNIRLVERRQNIVEIAQNALNRSAIVDNDSSDEEELLLQREDLSQKINRFQDFLLVNTPKLTLRFDSSAKGVNIIPYKNMQVADVLLPSLSIKEKILNKAIDDSLWKYTETSIDDLEARLQSEGFSKQEQHFTKQVLDYIEKSNVGVRSAELVKQFSNENLLIKSLALLRVLFLIKRVGVGSFMYAHKRNVRPWIIHSFHLKRLEKEKITPQSEVRFETMKRKHQDERAKEEPFMKKLKKDEISASGKRTLKPIKRYTDEEISMKASTTPTKKIIVNLRPAPWIRINGSLNRRVFDKWIGTILIECTIRCGIPVKSLYVRFNQLHPVNILFLLECLQDLECIQLKVYQYKPVTLFSDNCDIEISDGNELSNADNMFAIVQPNALLKMALFIGDKKYQVDF